MAAFPLWPAGFGDQLSPASYAASRIEHQYNDKTERLEIKKISGGAHRCRALQLGGRSGPVFCRCLPARRSAKRGCGHAAQSGRCAQRLAESQAGGDHQGRCAGSRRRAISEAPTAERLYVGPKSLGVLESVAVPTVIGAPQDLRSLVNFGFFGVIARPLFLWLKWTYEKVVHNWGWAIAIQTLIINLALLPLRISSMKSALKMQKVAPQIKAIQEKYKKYSMRDPRKQEMNQEVSALYKAEGVNPVGGCLPMIIQMPFLFAYYSMLGAALDLRHAPWLWIRDLSSPDPWHHIADWDYHHHAAHPAYDAAARHGPVPAEDDDLDDAADAGRISWNLAAGLCLYWSEGNLIAIAQQASHEPYQPGP